MKTILAGSLTLLLLGTARASLGDGGRRARRCASPSEAGGQGHDAASIATRRNGGRAERLGFVVSTDVSNEGQYGTETRMNVIGL